MINSSKILLKSLYTILVLFGVLAIQTNTAKVYAQDEYPREYTNPDEIVAFDKSTNYVEAIEVINQFLQEYRNKFIIDQSAATGPIGVTLPAMHWEDALKYILRVKNLGVREFDDYIEILPLSVLEAEAAPEQQAATVTTAGGASQINLKTREIRINATFFEGNKRALQEIGVDWSTLTNNVPANLNDIVAGDGGTPQDGIPQVNFNDQFVSVNTYNASSVSQNVFNALINLGEVGPGIQVQALFSAFEADNMGEVLATPSVKVMDGQEGKIQVGQDFSIKQRDIAGNVTDQFFETGTILTVTPTIIETNDTAFVHLDILVERSSAQPDAVSTIINKQEAQTQALLLDGEATSIAGLYRTEETKVRRGVPILKDLPPWLFGLRYLFGYNSNDFVENELIIIVQAELEESLEQRINKRFNTKREVLDTRRDQLKNNLDRVFENPYLPASAQQEEVPEGEPAEETQDDSTEDDSPSSDDEETESTEEDPEDELTDEQKQLAEELTLPIENPELMVVVPRAYSLDDYLREKANGNSVEDETAKDLNFFVIGGSFLVKRNANRFNQNLMDNGYETRILFHPESRFNYVAYKGFADFDEAVEYLKGVRENQNQEAWLFVKTD